MAGYSGTPLGRKLGLKDSMRVRFVDAPEGYADDLLRDTGLAPSSARSNLDLVQIFVRDAKALRAGLESWLGRIAPDGMIWVSWPKKASKIATDVTEDVIRAVALPLGLVDVKVCAVDDTWSALKLVIRRELRNISTAKSQRPK
jgi:hypothetical protein